MEAAEKLDNPTKSMFDIGLAESLQSTLQLLVGIVGHVRRCLLTIVHECHEGGVSGLLEFNIILEALLHHEIHLILKVHQLGREFDRIFQQCLIFGDVLAARHNIRVHFENHVLETLTVSLEKIEHEAELVKFGGREHVLAARVHVYCGLGLLCDQLLHQDLETFYFGFRL